MPLLWTTCRAASPGSHVGSPEIEICYTATQRSATAIVISSFFSTQCWPRRVRQLQHEAILSFLCSTSRSGNDSHRVCTSKSVEAFNRLTSSLVSWENVSAQAFSIQGPILKTLYSGNTGGPWNFWFGDWARSRRRKGNDVLFMVGGSFNRIDHRDRKGLPEKKHAASVGGVFLGKLHCLRMP